MKVSAIGILGVALAALVVVSTRDVNPARPAVPRNSVAVESARIQRHLATVEQELMSRDVSFLTPAQQRARREEIRRLHGYWLAGRFQRNHDFPGRRVPYFVDRHGTTCAMAYLIAASGGRDLVDQVARSANNARVMEIAADPVLGPALVSWLEIEGLTVEEAQRIQPSYDYSPPARTKITAAYGAASGATGALNIASVIVNGSASAAWWWVPLAGLASGSTEVMLGKAKLERAPPARTLGVINVMVGATSIVASISALLRSPERPSAAARNSTLRVALTPTADLDGAIVGLRAVF